ncbi:hypothetical protein TMEC54S_00283 [Thauera mechernichensis]
MGIHVKKCGYCKFNIPRDAEVCGHCGATFETIISERHWSVRFLFGLWGLLRGLVLFSIAALIAAYFFTEPDNIGIWTIVGGLLGAVVGFSDEMVKSKEKKEEICTRP